MGEVIVPEKEFMSQHVRDIVNSVTENGIVRFS